MSELYPTHVVANRKQWVEWKNSPPHPEEGAYVWTDEQLPRQDDQY